ncbi:type II toxin-antitoxin system RelE/ParE family toxin [Candidatus Micrarchaeota archaeon]|nr:type II toxin-antitoxin system RelE/ParE family toxin [Candidatus Micrarchaeota archaeon]MBU1166680.1 type II toxin-antitoxin system RelE/ParE family toxin [Candidatus Micrarchaeota archaeon]MBU1886105.1 type II toxin-antitoxin system RelE/ParE family toxin [Candidatus Micrarchaeota archaeon]
MFKVLFSQEALYQLKKLDNQIVSRILEKINETVTNPIHYFKRLKGRDEYKLRIGDYRVIANIMQNEKTVFIRSLGHRKNIYSK